MIKQECIGIPDMILLLMIFCFKKIKIKAEIVLSPGGAYFLDVFYSQYMTSRGRKLNPVLADFDRSAHFVWVLFIVI